MYSLLRRLLCLLPALGLLSACSIDVSGGTPVPTVAIKVIGASSTPTPGAGQTPEAEPTRPAWRDLGLAGRLTFTQGALGVKQLDLQTGEVKTLFAPPKDGWLTAATQSPDGSRLVLAYAPPPPQGQAQLGYTGLYELPGDCGTRPDGCSAADLKVLVAQADPHEAYFSPAFGPDGQVLYLAHFTPSKSDSNQAFSYTIARLGLPDGQPQVVVNDALWPAVAPDGNQIAYVYSNPQDYSNTLFLANADGTNAHALVDTKAFDAVDAPFFSADGRWVIFSAVGEGPGGAGATPTALGWLDRLLGVRVASAAPEAHNVPSDWWQVPLAGGAPTRLTRLYDTGLFGAAGPDGRYLAFLSASGLYLLQPDGSGLTLLLKTSSTGTVRWLP